MIQGLGLTILRHWDGVVQQDRDEGLYLKLALVAGDPDRWLTILFPELFTSTSEDVSDLLDDEAMINNPNVTLKFKETPDPAHAEEILMGLLGQAGGVLTGVDTFNPGTGKFWSKED